MTLRAEFALNHAIKGFGMDFEKALELLRNHNDGLTKLEKEAIDFYIEKCINNLNTWIVVAHYVHPTEEESLNLMFKIMSTLKDLGYKYERSYNKLKVYVNE